MAAQLADHLLDPAVVVPVGLAGRQISTQLFMPQGSASGTANGDYITTGIDDPYRYFVEVPAGASRLVVDLFDADWGAGGAGEAEIARFVAGWLREAGLEVELHDLGAKRANVIAIARGSGGGRSLMLNAHMDTVGAGEMTDPFVPRIEGERLYGRGAFDMKASLAAIMFVFGLVMPNVDNWAHAGGFGGGYLAARVLDPLKPERVDHLLGAVICLFLSMLSIVVSVLHWFYLLGLDTR